MAEERNWIDELDAIVRQMEEITTEDSFVTMLRGITTICREGEFKKARETAEKCWEHIDMWYYGLDTMPLHNKSLPDNQKSNIRKLTQLIEKAQEILIRDLGALPQESISPFLITALYTP